MYEHIDATHQLNELKGHNYEAELWKQTKKLDTLNTN